MASKNQHHVPDLRQFTPQMLEQLIDNQTKELSLRAKEIDLNRQRDEHAYEFGREALQAQKEDRQNQREHNRIMQRNGLVLVGVIVVILTIIVIVALFLNKESVAMEIIKACAFFTTGGALGYSARTKKAVVKSDETGL